MHNLAHSTLRFDLNMVFSVADTAFFLDGWIAGPGGEITTVHVIDEDGNATKVPFAAYQFTREDVVDALKGAVPSSRCIGYRMLITYPLGNTRPVAVTIHTSEGASFTQHLEEVYTDALRRAWKIETLSTTPEHYGIAQPLAENPIYNRLIVAPSKALLEKQTSFEGHIDGWHKGEDGSIVLFGWIDDHGSLAGEGRLRDAKTSEELPSAAMFRYYRADLGPKRDGPMGMLLFTKTLDADLPRKVRFQTQTRRDVILSLNDNRVTSNTLLEVLLSLYELSRKLDLSDGDRQQLSRLFIPIIEHVHAERSRNSFVVEEVRFGESVAQPEVSIVIPIYKAYELARQQMIDFALDSFFVRQDVILVLDAPEDRKRFKQWMHRLYDLYRVPVRVLIMNQNGGFGRACNAGAGAARAPHVLFLNSDVFPKQPGWLGSMLERLKEDASVGVVGARLLFPDKSIQHAGMTWHRKAALDHQLINHHPWKGMDPSLVPHRGAVEVPAVTAACLLCRMEEFRSVGMFDEGYIQGDYEDSDLCLKMRQQGKRVVCDHDAVLYHVEGNSYPPENRKRVFFYNAMRHELRWGAFIAQLTRDRLNGENAR